MVASSVIGTMPPKYNNRVGLNFAQGLYKVDKNLTDLMYDSILPSTYDNDQFEHARPKRAIRWACRLVRLASVTGAGESQLSDVIAKRVPERWQGAVNRALQSGGAKRLIQLAAFLCQFQGGSELFSADRSALLKVFEHSFLEHNVPFTSFVAYAEWLEAGLQTAFAVAEEDLDNMQSWVHKVCDEFNGRFVCVN